MNLERSRSCMSAAASIRGISEVGIHKVINRLESLFTRPRFIKGVYIQYIRRRQHLFCKIFEKFYIHPMPNQRSPGQVLINVPVKESFRRELNDCVRKSGYLDRSAFIRDAIREKLIRMGIIPPEKCDPPSRIGKGGRPKIVYPEHKPDHHSLNTTPANLEAAEDTALENKKSDAVPEGESGAPSGITYAPKRPVRKKSKKPKQPPI